MAKIKLSPTQQKVIDTLKDGKIIHWVDGINAKCFYRDNHKTISWATIFKLEHMGLIYRDCKTMKIKLL